jgi:hypothetical protein
MIIILLLLVIIGLLLILVVGVKRFFITLIIGYSLYLLISTYMAAFKAIG